jgi:hypothetical protein
VKEMSTFNRFYKREKIFNRTLDIDEELYTKLEYISKYILDASVNKLVNAAIEELIKTEDVKVYKILNSNYVTRSFAIKESLVEGLYDLKSEYGISIRALVNIAIKNALEELERDSPEFKEFCKNI